MLSSQAETYLDDRFARFLADRSNLNEIEKEVFYDIIFRLSTALKDGHSCLRVTPKEQELLEKTRLVKNIAEDQGTNPQPLVLYRSTLYLEKYYSYEARLAYQIGELSKGEFDVKFDPAVASTIFPGESVENSDQMRAAVMALTRALIIVSGGPGTGKTTTVVKMLALLLMHQKNTVRIGLAAPTGKAAMRLSESIGNSVEKLTLPVAIQELIPQNALTLHRLLGVKKHSQQFRHNKQHPMHFDVVVVDEASMVDLAMMSKLVDALKPGGRLILLGDKDQLASVESGAVLSDFIYSLPANSVELKKTYRFDGNIKRLATSINNADHKQVWKQLIAGSSNVSLLKEEDFYPYTSHRYGEYLHFVQNAKQFNNSFLSDAFERFKGFQVLCGIAFTEYGVKAINRKIEQRLALAGLQCKQDDWYTGRPVLITRNDYGLELYNGDIGLCFWDDVHGSYRVWFERADGNFSSCVINLLPPHQTVYAMTIHKSQGSEFGEVLVVLPTEDNRVLCRELIYTAVTRAKSSVKLMGDPSILELALQRRHQRHSGLRHMLVAH